MSTKAIKLDLINWLTQLKDKKLLESLLSVKDSTQSNDWYNFLSSAQKKSLDKGIADFKKGKFQTSKQFWVSYEKA